MRYFFRFELTEIEAWARLLKNIDSTCLDVQTEWFSIQEVIIEHFVERKNACPPSLLTLKEVV